MPVRIRLARMGCRNNPFYRMVVADSRAPRDGRFIEKVGSYNPIPNKDNVKEVIVNSERVRYWLSVGAQPSARIEWLFGKLGILPPAPIRDGQINSVPKILRPKVVAVAAPATPAKAAPKKAKA